MSNENRAFRIAPCSVLPRFPLRVTSFSSNFAFFADDTPRLMSLGGGRTARDFSADFLRTSLTAPHHWNLSYTTVQCCHVQISLGQYCEAEECSVLWRFVSCSQLASHESAAEPTHWVHSVEFFMMSTRSSKVIYVSLPFHTFFYVPVYGVCVHVRMSCN